MMKTKKIELIRETATGGYETEQHTIRPIRLDQFEDVVKIVSEIIHMIQNDKNLSGLFQDIFAGGRTYVTREELMGLTSEEQDQLIAQRKEEAENEFAVTMFASLDTLLLHLPKQTIDLISAASRIDRELLVQQDIFTTVWDIVEAIIEVNDLETLVERGKKFSGAMRKALAFLKKDENEATPTLQ